MKLYAARHGETTWNVEKRILGLTPGELTEMGRKQASELARHIAKLGAEIGYASDLYRAVETSEIITTVVPHLHFERSASLRERNFGQLEGKLFTEVDWDKFWAQDSRSTDFDSESLHSFTERIARFIVSLAEREHKVIMLITHSGVMNRLNYLSDPQSFRVVNYDHAFATEFPYEKLLANSEHFLGGKLLLE